MKTHAFPIQLAKEAILLDRYNEAIALLKPLDDPDAQFLRAYLHFWDDDLSRTDAIALMEQLDHPQAQYILAVCPDLSPGYVFELPTDQKRFDRLQHAAELGSEAAITDLAHCYLEGVGVEKDEVKARELLMEVYEPSTRKHIYSKTGLLLGQILIEGIGGEQNIDKGQRALAHGAYTLRNPPEPVATEFVIRYLRDQTFSIDDQAEIDSLIAFLEVELSKVEYKPYPLWQRFLHYYSLKTLVYDLRGASLVMFQDFLFDHFPQWRQDTRDFRWVRNVEVLFDPPEVVRLYTQLFQNSVVLPDHYSTEQLKQGLEMDGMRGWSNWTPACVMADASTPVDDVIECIHSMYELFVQLFSDTDFYDIGFMWWDIGYGACDSDWRQDPRVNIRESNKEVSQRIEQATFDTIVKVLHMRNRNSQKAGLHGLQHRAMGHPDKERVLRQYLEDNPDAPEHLREYAMWILEHVV